MVEKIVREIGKAVELVLREKNQAIEGRKIAESPATLQKNIIETANHAKEPVVKIAGFVPRRLEVTGKVMQSLWEVADVAEHDATSTSQVSSSAQEVTASMEEMTSEATELTRTASELRDLVGQFKIE